jgi:hypothetical protein
MKLFTSVLLSAFVSSAGFAASEGMLENRKASEPAVCLFSIGVQHKVSSGKNKEMSLTDKFTFEFSRNGILFKTNGYSKLVACGERAYPSESRKSGPVEKN